MSRLSSLATLGLLLSAFGCTDDASKTGAAPARFEAVRAEAPAGGSFCEKSFPASGPGAKRYAAPPLRALPPGVKGPAEPAVGGWTWVNLWATWCTPCRDELPLLAKWRDALAREGRPFRLELLSADAPADGAALAKAIASGLPGPVTWLRGEDDLGPYLDSLGIDRNAALPIHALVDPRGQLRCVRVGAIHDRDYPVVKAMLAGE